MREIKFRGKRIDNGEWVYGGYYKHIKRQVSPIGDSLKESDIEHLIIQSGFADWNMPRPLQAVDVIPDTVGQFTGLLDKSGKEIYEGDIVVITYERWRKYSVEYWDKGLGSYVLIKDGKYFESYLADYDEIEVINNIHEQEE